MTNELIFGGSSADKWLNCAYYVQGAARAIRTTSPEAEAGTKAHNEAAEILRLFMKNPIHFRTYPPDIEDEAIKKYIDVVLENVDVTQDILEVEKKLHMLHLDSTLCGTADAVILKPDRAVIIDFKYGEHIEVEAYQNPQLMYYALMFLNSIRPYETIDLIIVQPRCRGNAVKQWTVTKQELSDFYKRVEAAMTRARRTSEAVMGDWCMFCPAKPSCPAHIEAAKDLVPVDKTINLPEVKELTPQQISSILDRKKNAIKWLESVESYGIVLAQIGLDIPGYQLRQKDAYPSWKDEKEATNFIANKYLDVDDECIISKLKTPIQCKKILSSCGDISDLDEFIEVKKCAPKLYKDKDNG